MPDPYQTALARIRQAAERGATSLDLSGLNIYCRIPRMRTTT